MTQKRIYSLADFVLYLWQARLFLFVGVLAGCGIALVLFLSLKPQYEAWMIVAPPRQGAESLNFLAEDAPSVLNPGSVQATSLDGEYVRFKQSLRGPAVAEVFIKLDGVLKSLNDKTSFRGGTGRLSNAVDVADHFYKNIKIDPIGDTGSVRLTYTHPDPEFAAKSLRSLVKIGDQLIRMDVRADVDSRIDWLKREMKTRLNPDHRKSLTRLLMAEERRRMLLSIETPYALSVIEEASASPRAVSPRGAILFPVLCLFGFILGLLAFTLRQELLGRRDVSNAF